MLSVCVGLPQRIHLTLLVVMGDRFVDNVKILKSTLDNILVFFFKVIVNI